MASNEYNDMAELIKEYYDVPVGTYLNQSISINSVTLACDIYRVEPETVLTSSVFTGCTAVDANTQIVIGRNMSVASGTTLTPPYRCKGIVIGDVGTFTNEGIISMTARGASGAGQNIQLTTSYMISAVGGAGGNSTHSESSDSSSYNSVVGNSGSSPSSGILSCGGGGAGGAVSAYSIANSGAGGSGTSFSGGSGGGGAGRAHQNVSGRVTSTGGNGSSSGGAGGNGSTKQYDTLSESYGGAGNPKGTSYDPSATANSDGSGTGGLIIVISSDIVSSGDFNANGVAGIGGSANKAAGGGASGGGCVVLLSRTSDITGTHSVAGGSSSSMTGSNSASGGAGGAGVYASYIVPDLILSNLPVEIAISDTNHLDNIEPSEGVRLLGMMDDDELYYEIMGTRHSSGSGHILEDEEGTALTKRKTLAINSPLTVEDDSVNEKTDLGVDTDVDLSVIHAPGTTGQVDGHIYSTDETVVGTWIDGKPVYEKTMDNLYLPSVIDGLPDVSVYPLSGISIDKVISIGGVRTTNTGIFTDINNTFAIGEKTYYTAAQCTDNTQTSTPNSIRLTTNRENMNSYACTITVRYTKTTDTV